MLAFTIVAGCTGSIGGEGTRTGSGDTSETQDPTIVDLTKPLPGEDAKGYSGTLFPRLTGLQWRSSALLLLGLPSSTEVAVPSEPRLDRFDFSTDESVSVVAETSLTQFRDAAESLSLLATKDDSAVVALLPAGSPADLAGRAKAFVLSFLERAFRRPASGDEVAKYTKFVTDASGGSDSQKLKTGIRLVIQVALQSPLFMSRVELGAADKVKVSLAGGRVELTPYELAARVSLALFDTAPDPAMLADVKSGKYDTPATYDAQLALLLQDPRAKGVLLRFHEELFAVERFGQIAKDINVFPGFSPQLAEDMRSDMTQTISAVLDSGGGIRQLLTTRTGYVNARLAPTYGLAAAKYGSPFAEVELPAERAGVLNRAGWAAYTAGNVQRRVVIRGLYVAKNLLCESILSAKDPPKTPAEYPEGLRTNRQRMEFTTDEPTCKGCHSVMNPKGFAFEHLDAAGVYQSKDAGENIISTGKITLDGKSVEFDGSAQMMSLIAQSEQVQSCYAKRWTDYLLGYDRSSLASNIRAQAALAASKSNLSVRDVVRLVLRSPAFTTRKIFGECPMIRIGSRNFLIGAGGLAYALAALEGITPREAHADSGPAKFLMVYA